MSGKTTLWDAQTIAKLTAGHASKNFDITGLSIDTRSLKKGDLFIALKDQRDGHDFVDAAFKAGASGCLVEKAVSGPNIQVENTLNALRAMAVEARARSQALTVGVTGSVGKTSLKDMILLVFEAEGKAHASQKSFNNHWGTPLSLALMPAQTEYAVFEMGMNAPGEIRDRTNLVTPDMAVITKIAPAHLEGLGSVEAVADAKAEIFEGLTDKRVAILPVDDAYFARLKAEASKHSENIITFGKAEDADIRVLSFQANGEKSHGQFLSEGKIHEGEFQLVGEHWAYNIAAALAVAKGASIDLDRAMAALRHYVPPAGRGTIEKLKLSDNRNITLIDDAYNANPESMRASLASFKQREGKYRLVILGEMKELGANSAKLHASLAPDILRTGIDTLWLVGDEMRYLADALHQGLEMRFFENADEALESVNKVLKNDSLVLLKGSNASRIGDIAAAIRGLSQDNTGSALQGRSDHAL